MNTGSTCSECMINRPEPKKESSSTPQPKEEKNNSSGASSIFGTPSNTGFSFGFSSSQPKEDKNKSGSSSSVFGASSNNGTNTGFSFGTPSQPKEDKNGSNGAPGASLFGTSTGFSFGAPSSQPKDEKTLAVGGSIFGAPAKPKEEKKETTPVFGAPSNTGFSFGGSSQPSSVFGAASGVSLPVANDKKPTMGKTDGIVWRSNGSGDPESLGTTMNRWSEMLDREVQAVADEILRVHQWDALILNSFVNVEFLKQQCEALSSGQKHLLEVLEGIARDQNHLEEMIADLRSNVSRGSATREQRNAQQQHKDALERATELNRKIAAMTKAADSLRQEIHRASSMNTQNLAALLLQNRTTLQTTNGMLQNLQNRVDSLPK